MAVLLILRPDARFSLLVLRPLFAGESGVVLREVAGQVAVGSACSRSSLAQFSKVATASAPAGKRSGGSSRAARWTSASASLAGSPPCRPFMLFHAATVCSVRSA
jgi:hypothetical protein